MSDFLIGLDLGQAQDYTALPILERIEVADDAYRASNGRLGTCQQVYHLRHLGRYELGTRYPAIIADVARLVSRPPVAGHYTLIADATGVGRPVLDMFVDAGLQPVGITITGGHEVTEDDDGFHVPKRDLVSAVQVLFQSGRLKIVDSLPLASTLVKELLAFRVKISEKANDTYGAWREGAHDDLVLAVAMACWYGERTPPVRLW